MKPTECLARQKKSKKRGEERKRKVKVKTSVSLLNPKTLQANILHLDQKAAKCMTCKQLCCKF